MPDTPARPFGQADPDAENTQAQAELQRLARHAQTIAAAAAAAARRTIPLDSAREAILYAIARNVCEEVTGPGTWGFADDPYISAIADHGQRLLDAHPSA